MSGRLELLALGSSAEACVAVATELGGVAYVNHADESDKRPYSGVLRVATDEIEAVAAVADVGLYVSLERVIKPLPSPPSADRVIAAFGMVGHPDMTHRQSDDHWRDRHAPLALTSHLAMCDYTQLSIVHTISGVALDGLAMCAFDNRQDLSDKFFNDDNAKAAISADVATFADTRSSLRRVVLTQAVG